ncbi:toxin-antitoxin system, antitoxin component, Xre family protein [Baaleninema sp.]|uniref:toxin-antitoxin system, antitoxin component, Xre family protein n=1 Tax=Baaleninema sp. TaxID=3101197 RepID=UPI0028F828F3|nr:toxin-antitoxin system, antitoxin component, Xre family protein [Geitlerinema sp. CS-897]
MFNEISARERQLLEKVRQLSERQQLQVQDFIDRLLETELDRELTNAAMKSSEAAFAEVWDNEDDAIYDNL